MPKFIAAAPRVISRAKSTAAIRPRNQGNALVGNTLYVYGVIDDELNAPEIVRQLDRLQASTITVRINSPGGYVSDAQGIYSALVRHRARKVIEIDGEAHSAASWLCCAGDDVGMVESGLMMIHSPSVIVGGTAADLRAMATALDKVHENIVQMFVAKTGADAKDISRMM